MALPEYLPIYRLLYGFASDRLGITGICNVSWTSLDLLAAAANTCETQRNPLCHVV
jgi:hypothetical protein